MSAALALVDSSFVVRSPSPEKPARSSDVLIAFLGGADGSLDAAFTRAVICKAELNHRGHSSSTPNGHSISLPLRSEAYVRQHKCELGGTAFSWQVAYRPK